MTEIDLLAILQRTYANFGETTYHPPGGSYGPAWLPFIGLVMVHTGSARVSVDGGPELLIPAGWISLRLPHRVEHYVFDEAVTTHHAWIHLRIEGWPTSILDRFAGLPEVLPASNALASLLAEAIAVTRTPLATTKPLLASLAAATLWRYVGEAESSARGDDVVERAQRFMHTYVGDPRVDLRRVAASANVSPPHLVRRFRRDLGITPMAYLWRRRVAIGIDLLTSTGLQVGDIATRAGFSSVYHFSRRIKAETGLPPTEVRRQRWSREEDGDHPARAPDQR